MPTSPHRRVTSALSRVVVAVLTLVLVIGPASAAVAGPWFSEPFNNGETDVFTGRDWAYWRSSASGHRGASLHSRIREGSHYGADSHINLSDLGKHREDEVYWRYWLRLDPDFEIESGERGKLPGPAGLYSSYCKGNQPSTESRPCWSARTMFALPRGHGMKGFVDQNRTLLGTYVYHVDQTRSAGDVLDWNEPAGLIENGRWHCIEGRVRMNTLGKADGVIQNWVDGQFAFGRDDFRFRRSGESQIHVKSLWMNAYYGGKSLSPADNDVWVDSLALSSQRVGCGDEDGYRFTDHAGSVHRANIDWFGARGITRGCNPPDNTLFCPEDPVTRGQMAVFLTRALELPAGSGNSFHDDDGSSFESAIEALAAADVTRGCNPPKNDKFCPDDPVTRGEMAAFLTRAWSLPGGSSDFTDVEGSPFVNDIGAIARAGVTKGCNPPDNDRYCPQDAVTRAQMATFVRRASVRVPS